MEEKHSYRQIVKTTSLFGGVEILRILVGVIQTKIVAVLLGPAGVGIQNLFNTALNMLTSFFGFGLEISAVKEIAQANVVNDRREISHSIITLRRWVMIMALIGAVFMIIMARPLSRWTFGVNDYAFQFVLLSLALVFTLISNGQIALIKGLRQLKDLAKASILGSLISLIISIPLFYLFKEKAIVPVIITTASCLLGCSFFYARRIVVSKTNISYKESFKKGKEMFRMGIFLMLSSFLMHLTSFIINSFINQNGSLDDVGFYRAGYLITTHYVGLVFAAMGADFLPRLSENNKDNKALSNIVHQQSLVAILIIVPMVAFLFPLAKIIIDIIYSSDFYVIENYISWATISLPFRACIWCLSYLMLAKGLAMKFFYSEVVGKVANVTFCIIGYKLWGITGLGLAFLANSLTSLLFNYWIVHRYCDFTFNRRFLLQLIGYTLVLLGLLTFHLLLNNLEGRILSIIAALVLTFYCLKTLQDKLDVDILAKLKIKRK
jgi:O-antigen/teichoic acid export membrane protein